MQNSTLSKKNEPNSDLTKKQLNCNKLQPSKKTLQNILQFAATYRAERISENNSVNIILN